MKLGTVTLPAAGSTPMPAAPSPASTGATVAAFSPPAPAQNAPSSAPQASMQAARQAAAQINEFLKSSAASVEFTVEGTSNQVIVRVVDSATRQVIRQMPTEETLAISRSLDRMTGLLLAQKA